MIRHLRLFLFPLLVLVSFQNCAKNAVNFSDSASSADGQGVTAGTTTVTGPTGTVCNPNGVTQAQVLTSQVENGSVAATIEYEVSLADCTGWGKVLSQAPILFDVNAILEWKDLTYEMIDSGQTYGDILTLIRGSDLFGNVGSGWAHWQTASVKYSSSAKKVRLIVHLNGVKLSPLGGGTQVGSMYYDTYLKFGDADPVTARVLFSQ